MGQKYAPICVASGDGIIEFGLLALAWNKVNARQELGPGIGRDRRLFCREERHGGLISVGCRSQHQVFQSAADSDVFFAQIRIERPDISSSVEVQLNR